MGLYLLDYGAGNVQSLANSLTRLGYTFQWVQSPADFDKATKLIFPGVGAFQTAIEYLTDRHLLEPLKHYISSGRPYFGICIGLQILFQSSTEAESSVKGLGIIPSCIERFDDSTKAVPHMGWNRTLFIGDVTSEMTFGVSESNAYYFVHSYRAGHHLSSNGVPAEWVHTVAQYGQEQFVSTVRNGNVFATQFHPEKSGLAGMNVLDQWLKISDSENIFIPKSIAPRPLPREDGFIRRIVACLDVRANDDGDLVVTKGDQYDVREKFLPTGLSIKTAGVVRNLGKPVTLAERYYLAGADEICFLNITSFRSSPLHDQPMLAVVRAAAEKVFVPLTIGGGIKDSTDPDGTFRPAVEVAGTYFRAGADKVSIGSDAVFAVEQLLANNNKPVGKSSIETIAKMYGRQAVVVSIDPKRVYVDRETHDKGQHSNEIVRGDDGKAWWYQCTVSGGRELRELGVVQLARGVELLGAGEILLNSIDRDGTGQGFDLDLINLVKRAVNIPVVASSGAGNASHFVDVFKSTNAEAALAAGIFHRGEVKISDVKETLSSQGINIRDFITNSGNE